MVAPNYALAFPVGSSIYHVESQGPPWVYIGRVGSVGVHLVQPTDEDHNRVKGFYYKIDPDVIKEYARYYEKPVKGDIWKTTHISLGGRGGEEYYRYQVETVSDGFVVLTYLNAPSGVVTLSVERLNYFMNTYEKESEESE